ncbi:hypothetical protein PFLUV_G00186420 [Perca fluviatilis]|uniref:TNFR-Cys domain-containing protein n=1 Tax=Perca fluviatilis TaxID=8168 RepID=A0A6A5EIF8_PERFL|nr:hypothetical protein PFLUV_G00186420 [Perca fluviatilis]
METGILPHTMMSRTHLTVAPLLILVMSVFRGHTLTCDPTEYQMGDQCCPKCPAGSRVGIDCTERRSTFCLGCDKGTFMSHPSQSIRCYACARCDSGSGVKIKTACTATSDTVCEPLEGFYCTNAIKDDCVEAQKHSSCQPGQYISQKGTALRDTECSDCSDGTFSNGTLLRSCQPHTQCESLNLQQIKPGNASTDAECGEQRSGALCFIFRLAERHRKKKGMQTIPNSSLKTTNIPMKKRKGWSLCKHRDSSSVTGEERSRINEIQLDAGTYV